MQIQAQMVIFNANLQVFNWVAKLQVIFNFLSVYQALWKWLLAPCLEVYDKTWLFLLLTSKSAPPQDKKWNSWKKNLSFPETI